MRVQLSDPARLRDLLDYLRAAECVADQANRDLVEVFVPRAGNEDEARRALDVLLATWRAMNPGVQAQVLSN